MHPQSIGVDVDDFRLPVREGLRRASDLRFRNAEIGAVTGELAPPNLSSSGRRHVTRLVEGLGLQLAALTADLPGLRLTDPRSADQRVAETLQILELARDLKTPTVTASVGTLTHPDTGELSPLAVEALRRIGEYADSRGVIFAIRPSGDGAERTGQLLDALGCPSIRICLDPAALVMAGVNPLPLIERLPDRIALVHARDGTAGLSERAGRETRLGEGEVDLVSILAGLSAADYHHPYILRRTDSQTPSQDLEEGRTVLARYLPK